LNQKPAAASFIAAISNSVSQRMKRAFSFYSESWPALAENRKNGRMNSAGAMFE
jgi:hypothetical protein